MKANARRARRANIVANPYANWPGSKPTSQPRNNPATKYEDVPGNAVVDEHTPLGREMVRTQLRKRARLDITVTYGRLTTRSLQFPMNFPRRIRRIVASKLAKRWFDSMRAQLEGKEAVPASMMDKFKANLPAWARRRFPATYKLVDEAPTEDVKAKAVVVMEMGNET